MTDGVRPGEQRRDDLGLGDTMSRDAVNDALVEVSASAADGRFLGVREILTADAVLDLFDNVTARGWGYLEITHPQSEWPMLAVSVSAEASVVHLFASAESVSLLTSETPAGTGTVEVLVMAQVSTFDLAYAVSAGLARIVVERFVRGGSLDVLVWERL